MGIELGDYTFGDGTVLVKELYRDLVPDLLSRNGQVFEKVEGLAITACGAVWVNNDNDGVDDNSGEQALLNVATVTTVPAKVGKKATKCSKSAKTAAPTRAKKVKNSKKR